jgi:hypothetical protein
MLGSPGNWYYSGVKNYVQTAEGDAGRVNINKKEQCWPLGSLGNGQQCEAEKTTAVHDK